MTALRFVDADVTLGAENVTFRGWEVGTDRTLQRLEECGVSEALVAHNAAVEGDPVTGNRMLTETLAALGGAKAGSKLKLHPCWALLPPATGEMGSTLELQQALAEHGVRGALLYPEMHGYSGARWCCGELYEMCEAMRMPVFTRLHLDFSYDSLYDLLSHHPGLELVLRNADYRMPRNLYRLMDQFENLRVESNRFSPFQGIEDVVRRFGVHRLLFGSGAPRYSAGAAVAMVILAELDEVSRGRIAGGNLEELMGRIRYNA